LPSIRMSMGLTNDAPPRRSDVRTGWDVFVYLIVPFRYHVPK
jgi:hypothetical protein